MALPENPFFLPALISAGIAAGLARIAWKRRTIPGAIPLMLLMLGVADWAFFYSLGLASPTLGSKVLFAKLQYFGIGTIPALWLATAVEYTGKKHWLSLRNILIIGIIPFITILLVFTNEAHALIWRSTTLDFSRNYPSLSIQYGSWFWISLAYAYLLTLTGSVLMFQAHIRAPKLYRRQSALILLAALLPWVGNVVRISGLSPFPDLDLTPFAFTFSGAVLAWGFFRYRLFDLVPVAHSVVLENIRDGVVVLDSFQRVVDINPAAAHFLEIKPDDIVGRPVDMLLPAPSDLLQCLQQTKPVSEFVLNMKGNKRHFELSQSPLMDASGNKTGKLLVFRDISPYQQTLEALRESEERFRQLTEAATDGVVVSRQGIILNANPQYLQIFGYQDHPDELIGKNLLDLSDPSYHAVVKENIVSGSGQNYRILGIKRDGTVFPLEIRARNSRSQDRHVRIAIVKDITQQLQVEEEIKRREDILQAVSFATEELLTGSQLDTDVPKVLEKLGQATRASRVYIFRNHQDEQGDLLTSQIHAWTSPGIQLQVNNLWPQDLSFEKNGLERWKTTLQSGLSIYGSVRNFPELEQKVLIPGGMISLLAAPIRVENAWWGFIGFDDCENERSWNNIEIEALETIGNSLGAAITRHETEKRLRHRAEELNSLYTLSLEIITPHDLPELLHKIVEQACRLLGGSGGGLYLANPEKREVKCMVSMDTPQDYTGTVLKYGEGAAGIVAQTLKPLLIKDYRFWPGRANVYEDEQPFKSLVSAPMTWNGVLIGVIHVLQNSQTDYFTSSNLELLTLFANLASVAFQNSHLYTAERRRVEELNALRATLTDISAELDLPRLLRAILERAVALLGGSGGDLCLYKPASQSVEVVVSYNLGKDYTGLEFPLGEGAMGRVIQTGKPMIVPDYQSWEGKIEAYSSQPWHAALAVPLMIGGRILGSVGVVQADPNREFDENDVSLFESFAQQAAIAIENAHLFDEMESYARRMALLNDITRVAVSAPDLQNMMQRLADRLGELFAADDVFITLWNPHLKIPIPSAAYGQFRDQYPHLHAEPGEDTMTKAVLVTGKVLVAEDVTKSSFVSPRIAAMFSTRAALGIPLIADERKLGAAIISYNQPRQFSEDDILLGEQAGAQVALAIAKAQSLEIEKQRTAELARANSMIMALGHVASRFEAAPDPDAVMETLGVELKQLGVRCLVALQPLGEPGLIIRYLSLPHKLIRLAERLAGRKIQDYRINPARFPFYRDVIENRQACVSDDNDIIIEAALPGLRPPILQRVVEMYGVTDKTLWFFLPLTAEEKVIGTLWMWGDMLEEAALPAASIFASQVAVALENARLYNEIQQLAITDELTDVYNRRGILELGQREVDRALRYNRPLTAVMVDIDHFKLVNDRYGHPLGDEVLRWLAEICHHNIREIDIIGRYGGEEFLILLPESEMRNSTQMAERLRQRVADAKIPTRVGDLSITISLGLSELNESTRDLKTLISRSDQALYAAKRAGRNRVITR